MDGQKARGGQHPSSQAGGYKVESLKPQPKSSGKLTLSTERVALLIHGGREGGEEMRIVDSRK